MRLAATTAPPLALLLAVGVGGTLLGWAAPSATAHAVEAARGLFDALGAPGETPWLPAARDISVYWAARGAPNRGIVFAAAVDASALLSIALVPLMVLPFWAAAARRRFAPLGPFNDGILRRGRLFGAGAVALMAALTWGLRAPAILRRRGPGARGGAGGRFPCVLLRTGLMGTDDPLRPGVRGRLADLRGRLRHPAVGAVSRVRRPAP